MNTDKLTRRETLKLGLAGTAGLALAGTRGAWATPTLPQAKAKAVIQIWMWGGPSHLDTFDPKPDAGADYFGPLDKPIKTNVTGIHIGQLLPNLAQQADKYALIRSMTHGVNAHETASYMVQTGRAPGDGIVYPSAGAVVSSFKGVDHGYKGLIPPYIVLTSPQGRFSEAGCLGSRYKPFATGGDPNKDPFTVEGVVAQGITEQRQRDRRTLLHELDSLGRVLPEHPQFVAVDRCEQKAYDLILGDAGKLFDLSAEGDAMRERYGRHTFGQSCLMARRLVEHGVPYVTINYRGWDTHKQHFQAMQKNLPHMDQGIAALLQDLHDHGLLDSTIVWCTGEFGRSPKIQWEPPWNGGRSHYGKCFSTLVAGGGFRGGAVLGATDARGEEVTDRPVHPREVLRSMYTRLGIDPEGPLPNPRGLDLKVLPETEGKGLLHEIM